MLFRSLHDYMESKGFLREEQVKDIMSQILFGYGTLFKNNIIHGSIKPRNVIIHKDQGLNAKLTDYCINDLIKDKEYTAPEIISNICTPNVVSDIWSLGAVMKFILGDDENLEYYSKVLFNLMNGCLNSDPLKRLSFNEILAHPFFTSTEFPKKITRDSLYTCMCCNDSDIILTCKDSFCMGCFAHMRWKSKFTAENPQKLLDEDIINRDKVDTYKDVLIKCPTCLSFASIGKSIHDLETLKLRCGCIYKNCVEFSKFINETNEHSTSINSGIMLYILK